MKNILNFIPGFRSGSKWKMIIAIIYYLLVLITLAGGIGAFLIFLSMPFIFFYTIKSIKLKKREPIIILVSAIILFGVGVGVSPKTEPTSTKASADKTSVESNKVKNSTDKTKSSNETKVAAIESTTNTTSTQNNSTSAQINNDGQATNASTENQQPSKDTSNSQTESKPQSSQVSQPAPAPVKEETKPVEVQEKKVQENVEQKSTPQPQQITPKSASAPTPAPKPVQTPAPAPTPTQEVKPSAPVTADRLVYYVPKGKSYHYDEHCRTLARSKTILSGNLQDVINMGKSDPCDVCVH